MQARRTAVVAALGPRPTTLTSKFARAAVLADLASDFLEHLLSLEKLQDHNLGFVFIEIDLALGHLPLEFSLLSVLLGQFPGAKTAHQLRVVIDLLHVDGTLAFKQALKFLLHVFGCCGSFRPIELILEFSSLLHFYFALIELLLHKQLLSLLLNRVGTFERLELLGQVVQKGSLLFLAHLLILVASLQLFLALLNTSSQVGCIFIELGLKLTFAS